MLRSLVNPAKVKSRAQSAPPTFVTVRDFERAYFIFTLLELILHTY